jgi:hypothetical protein
MNSHLSYNYYFIELFNDAEYYVEIFALVHATNLYIHLIT